VSARGVPEDVSHGDIDNIDKSAFRRSLSIQRTFARLKPKGLDRSDRYPSGSTVEERHLASSRGDNTNNRAPGMHAVGGSRIARRLDASAQDLVCSCRAPTEHDSVRKGSP
jgi:hypothetical protein